VLGEHGAGASKQEHVFGELGGLVSLLIRRLPSDSPSSDNCFCLCLLIGLVCLCGLLSLSVRVETASLRVDTRQVQDVYLSRNRADTSLGVRQLPGGHVLRALFNSICNNRRFHRLVQRMQN
jgi:hypothetical protein